MMKHYVKEAVMLLAMLIAASCTGRIEEIISEAVGVDDSGISALCGTADIYLTEEMAEIVEASEDGGNVVPATKSMALNNVLETIGVVSMKRIFHDGGEFEQRRRAAGLHRWYRIEYSKEMPSTKAMANLGSVDGIESVEPVYRIRQSAVFFNDPEFPKQWHYMNDGSMSQSHSAGADINVVPVWERYTCGNRKVIVAVVDGGIDCEHEDLAENYVGGKNFVSGGQVTADEHGTHVAGTIAARNNNGIGVCGIAGGNAAEEADGVGLLSCQVFVGKKSGDEAEAITWAADNGAVIVNNSWGYDFETVGDARNATIPGPLKAAIDYFVQNAGCDKDGIQKTDSPMKGGLVVFAAGNDGWDANPIGEYESVLAVGAIGPDFKRASYSNYGSWVDIASPGGEQGTRNNTLILSTLPGNKYGWMQGTSMACPHVSGVAALVVSHFGGPGFTVEMLKKRLLEGARHDVLPSNAQIGPLVDAMGAFSVGKTMPPEIPDKIEMSATGNRINATFNVTASPEGEAAFGYMLLVSKSRSALESITDPRNLPADVFRSEILVGNRNAGERITASIGNLEFEQEYYAGIIGYDYAQNYSALSSISAVRTLANTAPIINCLSDKTQFVLKSFESVSVPFEIYDPEGEEITVKFNKGSSASSFEKTDERHWTLNINARMEKAGEYEDRISVSDTYGMDATYSFKYEILPNRTPEVRKVIDNLYTETTTCEYVLDLNDFFHDPDGESLRYSMEGGSKSVATTDLSGSSLRITVKGYGLCKFIVSASDARNASCTQEFSIMAKSPDNLVEMYPVPVKDNLTIRTGLPAETYISVTSLSGIVICESTSTVSAFAPKVVDLRNCAPGRYLVRVLIDGKSYERVITKL